MKVHVSNGQYETKERLIHQVVISPLWPAAWPGLPDCSRLGDTAAADYPTCTVGWTDTLDWT